METEKIKILLCGIFVALLTMSSAMAALKVTDSNKPIMVNKSNPIITITTQSNRTTGYMWFLTKYDSKLFKPLTHEYVAKKTKLVGAGGYEIWTFRVLPEAFVVPQVSNITLQYNRPWNLQDGKSVSYKIVTDDS